MEIVIVGRKPDRKRGEEPRAAAETGASGAPTDVGTWGSSAGFAPQPSPADTERPIGDIATSVGVGVAKGVGEFALDAAWFIVASGLSFGVYGTYGIAESVWNGYKEMGALGAFSAINPFNSIGKEVAKAKHAADRGDHEEAGNHGAKAAMQVLTAVLLGVLAGKGGAAAAAEEAGAAETGAAGAAETGAAGTVPRLGEFSVVDWKGYPASLPKPSGPFRLLEGAEYQAARDAANRANAALRAADPGAYAGKQIHEIHPVKFGGSPTDPANKAALTPGEHAGYTTFWNRMMRDLQ